MSAKMDKKLFTPGPLLCSATIKQAMLRDLGSRDVEFIKAVKAVRSGLLKVAAVGEQEWTVVPMQGSGTFSVEAVFQTAVPKNRKVILSICILHLPTPLSLCSRLHPWSVCCHQYLIYYLHRQPQRPLGSRYTSRTLAHCSAGILSSK